MKNINKHIPIIRKFYNEKKIINDPIFGTLTYDINFNDISPISKEVLNNLICPAPFFNVEINLHGEVTVCCHAWNPAVIGNVLDTNLATIWKDYKSNELRKTILDGSYKYCNKLNCEVIRNSMLVDKADFLKNQLLLSNNNLFPFNILLAIDQSCNLQCPSCRTSKINHNDNDEASKAMKIANNIFSSIFKEPHDQHILMQLDGAGEIFGSEIYRKLFETETVFTNTELWPNLKFIVSTNGVLMTEKIQKKYSKFFEKVTSLNISIDAGNKESYDKVRINGDWDLLWTNLNFLYENIKMEKKVWRWNLIVQKDNFRSIPEFVTRANTFKDNLPQLHFSNLLNWGTFSTDEFLEKAVYLPDNPLYQEYINIMNLPEVKNYSNKYFKIITMDGK